MDKQSYRIAVGGVGLGLVAFIFGAAIVLKTGHHVSREYWTAGSAISGALLGLLAHSPQATKKGKAAAATRAALLADTHQQAAAALQAAGAAPDTSAVVAHAEAAKASAEATKAQAPLTGAVAAGVLLVVFGVSLWAGIEYDLTQLQALAAAAGGALIGLIAPSPSTPEPSK